MIAHKMTPQKGFEPSTMKTPDTIIIIFKKMTLKERNMFTFI